MKSSRTTHEAAAAGRVSGEVTPSAHNVKFVDRLLATVKSDDNDDDDNSYGDTAKYGQRTTA